MESTYIGKKIGNYRVVSEIGSGSFGVVYRGEHIFLPHRVGAIKLLHAAHLDSWDDRESFLLEARMLEILKNPHILPILDVGIHEGFPYLVTEYAPQGSLRDRLQQIYPWLLPTGEAIKILSQVGEALHHAHRQNIIHRDLKPANILFNEKGDALLADFGIATTLATASLKFVRSAAPRLTWHQSNFKERSARKATSTPLVVSPTSFLQAAVHLLLLILLPWALNT